MCVKMAATARGPPWAFVTGKRSRTRACSYLSNLTCELVFRSFLFLLVYSRRRCGHVGFIFYLFEHTNVVCTEGCRTVSSSTQLPECGGHTVVCAARKPPAVPARPGHLGGSLRLPCHPEVFSRTERGSAKGP